MNVTFVSQFSQCKFGVSDTLDVNLHAQCYARPEQTGNGFGAMGMINSRGAHKVQSRFCQMIG